MAPPRGGAGTVALTCDRAIDLFADYLADDLAPCRCDAFIGHLRSCESCHDKLIVLEGATSTSPEPEPASSPDKVDPI